MKRILFSAAAVAAGLAAIPAEAAVIDLANCISVTDSAGCRYTGNANGGDTLSIQTQYNMNRDPDILLTFLTKSDDGDFGEFGSITGDGTTSGTWSLPDYLVDFIAVKAGNQFRLYQLATPASSGNWDTFDLFVGQGNNPDLSHLNFYGRPNPFGGVVPEPATWAMLIAGFGLVGAAMRRRRGLTQTAV